jgi:hypothetical protein
MLDRDGRREAAALLRAERLQPADVERAAELADALEAEPEGYDYESAAAERGEALRELLDALAEYATARAAGAGSHAAERLAEASERGRVVMEGVERTHMLVPLKVLRAAARHARAAVKAGPPMWRAERKALADALDSASRGERPEWPA